MSRDVGVFMLLLATKIGIVLSLTNPDPTLEAFHLETSPPEEAQIQPIEEEPEQPSFWWKLSGFMNYAAAGAAASGSFYREERSFGWEPAIQNDFARVATFGGTVEGLNIVSDQLYRRGNRKQAWFTRIGSIALYAVNAGVNFDRGWRRQ